MCHIQRKTESILTIPHVYLDLAPPCQKKSEIGQPPLPPLSEKIRNWQTPPPPFVRKNQKLRYWLYLKREH